MSDADAAAQTILVAVLTVVLPVVVFLMAGGLERAETKV
jgi:hypothetical protein